MRKLIAWNVATIDGFFEGKTEWDLSFHEAIWGPEMEAFSEEQLQNMDGLLFGRKTYDGMSAYWQSEAEPGPIANHMNALPKYVASKTLTSATWNNTKVLGPDVVAGVKDLKSERGKDIYVFGSAELLDTLLRHRLVDEYRIGLAPVVLGGGTPLFKPSDQSLKLHLLEASTLNNGGLILRYQPVYDSQ